MGPTQTAPALKEWLPSNCSATVVTGGRHPTTIAAGSDAIDLEKALQAAAQAGAEALMTMTIC